MVGVAFFQCVLRHAVETHYQFFRAAMFHPVIVDVGSQRLDVACVIVEMFDGADGRRVAHLLQFAEHDVGDGGRGTRRVLRIHRHDQDALAVLCFQLAQHAGNGRVAIAHGVVHHEWRLGAFAQIALQ